MNAEERDAYLDEVIWPPKGPHEIMYYHRDGTPCKTRREAFAAMEDREDGTPDSHWVAYTQNWRRSVSTIFLCLDHGRGAPAVPLIFESMVFEAGGDFADLDQDRYPTEASALAGHAELVRRYLGARQERRFLKNGSDDRWKQMRGRRLGIWANRAIKRFHTPHLWRRLTPWLEPWRRIDQ